MCGVRFKVKLISIMRNIAYNVAQESSSKILRGRITHT